MNHPARPRASRWDKAGQKPPKPSQPVEGKRKEPDKDVEKSTKHEPEHQLLQSCNVKKRPSDVATTSSSHHRPSLVIQAIGEACRSSDHYEKMEKVGEGTYGAVYKARCRETNELVALKRLKLESETEGFPITSIRESITLLKGKHPNVINVREIVFGNRLDQIYIVMDYMDRDLKSLMQAMKRPFKMAEVKLLMLQLISAVAHLHNNWILHRDLKTSNLLIHKGVLKLGDFGLAREYGSPLKQYTNKVVTLWYRAPELLLQTGKYSTPIDVWSIGCIFGELLLRKPLFPGQSEMQQIDLIFRALGSPSEDLWPDFERIRLVQKIKLPRYQYNQLLNMLEDRKLLSEKGFHLWNKLLAYDPGVKTKSNPDDEIKKPTHRISAEDALKHEFFDEEPRAIHPSLFPTWPKVEASRGQS